ncbi:4-hydroxybenzoate octaprenyltransferase [Psychrosphaera aquimarina]|uniref:4-hydroxybenzoate octaprenyltransferase n=1 Tax=Psychrosphaera aquimarina TaxID=2044854 RepID=A0ABU3QY87_9GAMM|nr:4-hydroxybenzoate octaprenyltransferase [Psychrosphaera aquimarina]MDU0112244.1 4-hydroxybenzoate octaprenyltransferase [Psychrosphaera aquimarina]
MRLLLKPSNFASYIQLMRMDKPIGIYLLMWPTLWALWIASDGFPLWHYLIVFLAGTVVMRAAGCVINDYADRHIDGDVTRTHQRPIPSGKVSSTEALQLFVLLIILAFLLVSTLDIQTIYLSVVGLLLAFCYPFMKRYTHYPQVVLGAAFSWSMPMVFMAVNADLPHELWLLYFANLSWTVAYDTLYAMVDREDDLKIGVKSTAIAFGKNDLLNVALLQIITLLLIGKVVLLLNWHWPVISSLVICALLFIRQLWQCRHREPKACFNAFLDNHYVGMVIFLGLVIEYALF